jgi:hypothetical protein
MIKLTFSTFIFFISFINFSQVAGFEKSIVGVSNSNLGINDIKTNSANELVLAGTISSNENNYAYLLKSDQNGDTLWSKLYYVDSQSMVINDVEHLADGYILNSNYFSVEHNRVNPLIMRVDQNGDVVWAKKYINNLFNTYSKLFKLEDGGFAMCTGTSPSPNSYDTCSNLVIKINADGDLEWGKTFKYNFGAGEVGANIVQIGTNFLLTLGAVLLNLDENGNIISQYKLQDNETKNDVLIDGIIKSNDQSIVFTAQYLKENMTRACVFKMDSLASEIQWSKSINLDYLDQNEVSFLFSIKNTSNSGLAMVYSIYNFYNFDIFRNGFLVLDSLGNGVFKKQTGLNENMLFKIVQTPDEGFAMTSRIFSQDNSSFPNFMKSDAHGNSFCTSSELLTTDNLNLNFVANSNIVNQIEYTFDSIVTVQTLRKSILDVKTTCPSSEQTIDIFPNPFSTEFTIVFGMPHLNTQIQIYDLLGQIVSSVLFSDKYYTFQAENLASSMYFVQITDASGKVATRKIVLE